MDQELNDEAEQHNREQPKISEQPELPDGLNVASCPERSEQLAENEDCEGGIPRLVDASTVVVLEGKRTQGDQRREPANHRGR